MMSFCHYLASGVCRLLTFHILIFSSETPQPNELKLGRKPQAILVSDWLISKKSSPLKPLGEMNQNLVGKTLWIELCTCNKVKPHIFIELLTF
jgi:hypothetical protein